MTIIEAIQQVLNDEGKPLTHKQIYSLIVSRKYYEFGAKDPISVVRSKLRKHCEGLNFASASPKKIFSLLREKVEQSNLFIKFGTNLHLQLLSQRLINLKHFQRK